MSSTREASRCARGEPCSADSRTGSRASSCLCSGRSWPGATPESHNHDDLPRARGAKPMTAGGQRRASADALDAGEAGNRYIQGSVFRIVAYGLTALMSVAAVPLVISHLGPVRYSYFATA